MSDFRLALAMSLVVAICSDALSEDTLVTLIDIFPTSHAMPDRKSRPTLHRARLAWARMRLVGGAQRAVAGIAEGDRVRVLISPGRWRTGVVQRWERADPSSSPVLTCTTVAHVALDPESNSAINMPDGIVRAPRTRITPAFPI